MIVVIPHASRTAYFPTATLNKSTVAAMGAAGISVIGIHGTADGIRIKALAPRLAFVNGKGPGSQPIPAPLFNPNAEGFFGF
jgi:hypothetical protein